MLQNLLDDTMEEGEITSEVTVSYLPLCMCGVGDSGGEYYCDPRCVLCEFE